MYLGVRDDGRTNNTTLNVYRYSGDSCSGNGHNMLTPIFQLLTNLSKLWFSEFLNILKDHIFKFFEIPKIKFLTTGLSVINTAPHAVYTFVPMYRIFGNTLIANCIGTCTLLYFTLCSFLFVFSNRVHYIILNGFSYNIYNILYSSPLDTANDDSDCYIIRTHTYYTFRTNYIYIYIHIHFNTKHTRDIIMYVLRRA